MYIIYVNNTLPLAHEISRDFWAAYGFAELSESELSTILEEKDAENTKNATKVTLNIF